MGFPHSPPAVTTFSHNCAQPGSNGALYHVSLPLWLLLPGQRMNTQSELGQIDARSEGFKVGFWVYLCEDGRWKFLDQQRKRVQKGEIKSWRMRLRGDPGKAYLGFIMADFTGWNCTIDWAGCPYVLNFLSNSEIPSKIFPFSLHGKKKVLAALTQEILMHVQNF